MKVAIFYFSNTGNTKRVAQIIGKKLVDAEINVEFHDLIQIVKKGNFDPEPLKSVDAIGVGMTVLYLTMWKGFMRDILPKALKSFLGSGTFPAAAFQAKELLYLKLMADFQAKGLVVLPLNSRVKVQLSLVRYHIYFILFIDLLD